jgi:molybdenum cofactor cytidylyltransferase
MLKKVQTKERKVISGILLAAGQSRRMGKFKQLLPFGGKSFLECCADNLLASNVDEVVVVTGHNAAAVQAALRDRAVKIAHNGQYSRGMSSSISRGIEAMSDRSRAALIALVDQPQIGPDIFNQVISVYLQSHPLIIIPTCRGKGGHPIIIDSSLRDQIIGMDLDLGLRDVLRAHESEIVRIEIGLDAILQDFDSPEDYERLSSGL